MKLGGPLLTPVARRIPMGPVSTTVLRYSGFMFPTAKPADVRRAVREFLTTPVDWYGHLAVAASEHRRVSLSKIDVPAAFVAGRWDVLASHRDMRTAADRIDGRDLRRALRHALPHAGAAEGDRRAAPRARSSAPTPSPSSALRAG